MPSKCSACDCLEIYTKEAKYSFHRFPKDPEKRNEWASKVKREIRDPVTGKIKIWTPKDHDVLCSRHFEEHCFTLRSRLSKDLTGIYVNTQLTPEAVPTLFGYNLNPRKRKEDASRINLRSASAAKKERREHFVDGESTVENPDPISAFGVNTRKRIGPTSQPAVPSARSTQREMIISPLISPTPDAEDYANPEVREQDAPSCVKKERDVDEEQEMKPEMNVADELKPVQTMHERKKEITAKSFVRDKKDLKRLFNSTPSEAELDSDTAPTYRSKMRIVLKTEPESETMTSERIDVKMEPEGYTKPSERIQVKMEADSDTEQSELCDWVVIKAEPDSDKDEPPVFFGTEEKR